MSAAAVPKLAGPDLALWLARRRLIRAAWLYLLLLAITLLMMGPFVYSLLLSVSAQPTHYPPILIPSNLQPSNLIAAYRLGEEGSGNGFIGGWDPGHRVSLQLSFISKGAPVTPQVAVLKVLGGTQIASLMTRSAPQVTRVSPPQLLSKRLLPGGRDLVTYRFGFRQVGSYPVSTLPVEITVPITMRYASGTETPTVIQNRFIQYALDYDSLTAGALPLLFGNYQNAVSTFRLGNGQPAFLRWIGNSALLALVMVLGNVLFGSMAGFALARLDFPGKWFIFYAFVIFSQMLPAQVMMPSNYLVIKSGLFGLTPDLLNTYWAVILPTLVGGFSAFIMRQFFLAIPKEVEEAARIDGAGTWQIYWQIILPMSKPALIALTILSFQSSWNNFFWPFVVYTRQSMYTLPIGLNFFKTYYTSGLPNWGLILSGAVISAVPVVLVFFFFQRYFVEGVSFSALKA